MRASVLLIVFASSACVTSRGVGSNQHRSSQDASEHLAQVQQDTNQANMAIMQQIMMINDNAAVSNVQVPTAQATELMPP
jgi:hypothetical protein